MTTYTWARCDDPPRPMAGGLINQIRFRQAHSRCREGRWVSDQERFGFYDLWHPTYLDGDPVTRVGDCEDFGLGLMLWCVEHDVPPESMRLYVGIIRYWWHPWAKPFAHAVVKLSTLKAGDLMSDIQCPSVIRWPTSKRSRYRDMKPAAKVVVQP